MPAAPAPPDRPMPTPQAPLPPAEVPRHALRGIIFYLLLTFGLAWTVDFAMIHRGVYLGHPPMWAVVALMGTMFFPAFSAFVVRIFITREGFRDAGIRLGPLRVYFAILVGVPAVFGIVYLLSWMLGYARLDLSLAAFIHHLSAQGAAQKLPSPRLMALLILAQSLTFAPLMTSLFTFGEEFGWTGYLLPKLLPLGKWPAATLYGFIWGLWHAPLIAAGYNYPQHPFGGIPMMCAFTLAVGFSQAALRLRYDSVFLTTWLHACLNTQSRGIWVLLFAGITPLLGGTLGAVGIATFAALGVYLLSHTPNRAS